MNSQQSQLVAEPMSENGIAQRIGQIHMELVRLRNQEAKLEAEKDKLLGRAARMQNLCDSQ